MSCNLYSVHVFTCTDKCTHAIYYADNSNDYRGRTQKVAVAFASFSHSNCRVTCQVLVPCASMAMRFSFIFGWWWWWW